MKLLFEWQEPILLAKNKRIVVDPDNLPERIESHSGIYFFARRYAKRTHPFYIGETSDLRARLRSHLKTAKIDRVLQGVSVRNGPNIGNGQRFFYYAYFKPRRGQQGKNASESLRRS